MTNSMIDGFSFFLCWYSLGWACLSALVILNKDIWKLTLCEVAQGIIGLPVALVTAPLWMPVILVLLGLAWTLDKLKAPVPSCPIIWRRK